MLLWQNSSFMNKFILLIVILLAIFLRFYQLDTIPAGIYVDEASHGYNAYSILLTGQDEYGKYFPIFLRSFGYYASTLYTYFTMLPISLLGLNELSIRLISATSGIFLLIITFFLVRTTTSNNLYAILAALVVTISPWAILFSRGAFEANLALSLFSSSILLCIYSLKKKFYLFPAIIALVLSIYSYHAERVLAILFIICFVYLFKHHFVNTKKTLFISLGLFVILQIPIFLLMNSPGPNIRLTQLSYHQTILNQSYSNHTFTDIILKAYFLLREFLSQYSAYFSPRNLFYDPDPQVIRSIPNLSVFYSWMVIPFIVGLIYLEKIRNQTLPKILLLIIILSPIPAALTKDPFSTLRVLPLLWSLSIIIALGIGQILQKTTKHYAYVLLGIACLFSVLIFYSHYFTLLRYQRAVDWGYGYKELASYANSYPNKPFIVDEQRAPIYIELALYTKYPPEIMQQQVDQTIKDNYYKHTLFNPRYKIKNIEIRPVVWREDIYKDQILVGSPLTISDQQAKEHKLIQVFEIQELTGKTVFRGYQTNPQEKCADSKNKVIINPLCI